MALTNIPDLEELEDDPENEQIASSSRLIQWLVVAGLVILFLPLYLVSTTIKADNDPLKTRMADNDIVLASTPAPIPGEEALKSTLVMVQQQVGTLEVVRPTVNANRLDWPITMAAIGSYDQTQVVLTSIIQNDTGITLNGQANDESAVMGYAQMLKDSNQFARVILQVITIKPSPTPLPPPTSTPIPTLTATSTVTATTLPGTKVKITPSATRTSTVVMTVTNVPSGPYDELSNKYAGFTIYLETKPLIDATLTPTSGRS